MNFRGILWMLGFHCLFFLTIRHPPRDEKRCYMEVREDRTEKGIYSLIKKNVE